MTLTIREGRYYWRRDGEREGPIERSPLASFGWKSTAGRHWFPGGRFLESREHPLDLIAEAPAGDCWTFWRGGECPVTPDTLVDYQVRGGQQAKIALKAKFLRWDHTGHLGDVIAYRVVKPAPAEPTCYSSYQARVQAWMQACFGPEISADAQERNHRFLEEALELVQACGCTLSEARQLVDYVFNRPVGDIHQESGGVSVTHAALCQARGIDMERAAEDELARVWTKIEKIRAKQAAKPKHSPLPEAAPCVGDPRDEWMIERIWELVRQIDRLHNAIRAEFGERWMQVIAARANLPSGQAQAAPPDGPPKRRLPPFREWYGRATRPPTMDELIENISDYLEQRLGREGE